MIIDRRWPSGKASVFPIAIFILIGLATVLPSCGQVFPVQSTTQLIPPYSVYLSDYAEPGNEKLRVILVQHDLTQPSYALRLVMSVELNGQLILRTTRTFNPPPIHLNAGIPTVISGADLSPYLDSRNIEFIGFNRAEYERTRALPEGSYQITFTAYDYRRQDVQVSNAGTSFYYLAKSEPPMVNYPACGSAVHLRTPQQVIFSWLARNTSSPNSAGNTQYEFSLYETRPPGRNPNDVVLSTPPVFKTTTELTQLIYGPGEPMLLDGMTYVWRVRAIDPKGTDSFRNNGYSEVCTFTYGGINPNINIGVIKNLQAQGETEHRAKIWWEKAEVDAYRVHYRKSSGEWEWFYSDVTTESLTASTEGFIKLFDLEAEVEYETRIQAKKDGFFGPYSDVVKFKMPPRRIAHCGEENNPATADQSRPLLSAIPNTTIDVDGIGMMLIVVEPLGNGWFKGVGEVTIPYLGGAYGVKFDKLFIDADRVAGNGHIDFITRGVALMLHQQAQNQKKNEQEKVQQQNRTVWNSTDFYEKIFQYDALDIETITADNASYINITDAQGNVTANAEVMQVLNSAPAKAIIIEDKNGDQWVVQTDKATGQTKVTTVEGGGLSPTDSPPAYASQDVVQKALQELHKEYLAKIDGYTLPDDKIDYAIAKAILYLSDENHSKDSYAFVAQNLTVETKTLGDYLAAARQQNKSEADHTATIKQAIVALEGTAMRNLMSMLYGFREQLTQAIGPGYSSRLGAGPLAYAPYMLPSCMPQDKDDRGIVRDYLDIANKNRAEADVFFNKLFEALSQNLLNNTASEERVCGVVVQRAGEYFVKFDLSQLGVAGECLERGMTRALRELLRSGITGATLIGHLEIALCLSEKDKCASANASDQFGYGLINGLLQQLDIPEMRDALIELLKTVAKNQLECLLHLESVTNKLTIDRDPKQAIKTITQCTLGIAVDVDETVVAFDAAWKFVQNNYKDPYLQGQATAFVVTIVLPPVAKALQATKIGLLLKNTRVGLTTKLKSLRNLEGLEAELDRVAAGLAKGAGKFSDQIDNTLARLTSKAKYSLSNTGEYQIVKGHHPMAKKAFEGDLAYDYQKAFSVNPSALDDAWKSINSGIPQNLHAKVTGQQNSLYSVWKQANPNTKLTIDVMANIEIQAMKNVGIPEDVATGWVVKSLEDLKARGVTEIKNIPWNGVN